MFCKQNASLQQLLSHMATVCLSILPLPLLLLLLLLQLQLLLLILLLLLLLPLLHRQIRCHIAQKMLQRGVVFTERQQKAWQ